MSFNNFFEGIPEQPESEVFEQIVKSKNTRIERIISHGHTSPKNEWYDQPNNEWVMVLEGKATLEYENGEFKELSRFDFVNIPAHVKHRVSWTEPNQKTVWIAVHY